MSVAYELSDILHLYETDFVQKQNIPLYKLKVLQDIRCCRTAYFGGHVDTCDSCGHTVVSYNSCRNRHCPKCQGLKKEQWIRNCSKDLLPVKYFHVVFTIPHQINDLALKYQKQIYDILFSTSWSVIESFSADKKHLGAKTAMLSILHTWGQNLSYHPHLHCIVPAGGIDDTDNWKHTKSKGKFLYPVKAMSVVFRARFMEKLRAFAKSVDIRFSKEFTDELFSHQWVVYAKRPFKSVENVMEYLARYSHRVAISNSRIISIDGGRIKFWAKNYRKNGEKEVVDLSANEFLRRFCMHILPLRFRKIRHYGFLCNGQKKKYLEKIRLSLQAEVPAEKSSDWKTILKEKYDVDHDICPCCKKGKMVQIIELKRGQTYYQLE